MTTIKNLLLTGIIGLTIASCAKDPVEYNVVGNALPIVIAEHAQSFIDMKALEAELDSVYNVLAQRNAEIVDLKIDIENYKVLVGEQAAEIEVLTLLVADLEAKIADQEAQIILLQDLNIELDDQNTKLANANDELTQMNGHLQSDINNKQKEINALRAHIETLVASIGELTETINVRDTEIVQLEGDIMTITETIDNTIAEVTDLLTFDFSADEFIYANTKWEVADEYTNTSGVTFKRFESQANGSLTVKFRGDDRIGHTAVNVDWIQVREDQATNFKRFSGNNINIDEISVDTFATDYVAEIVVDDTLANSTAVELSLAFLSDEDENKPSTIVVNNVELTLDKDGLYSADGVRIRFVHSNAQNVIIGVIDGSGTNLVRSSFGHLGDATADELIIAAQKLIDTVTSFN